VTDRRESFRGGARLAAAALALGPTLGLSGCASPPTAFGLHPSSGHVSAARKSTVSVPRPDAAPPLDGEHIIVRESGDRLSTLGGAQWADRLTLLVQSRMIESFENAGLARFVRADGLPADKRLALEIRRFDIDADSRVARVDIAARLVSDASGATAAAKIFSASEPVTEISGAEPPVALDLAFGRVSRQIVAWAASR
jgi:cholesterol transport system auxiliary component